MVYRTTLAPVMTLRREMDRLLEDAFGRAAEPASIWHPAVDVREEQDAFVFELDLPGVEPASVEVTADKGVLTVRGEKRAARAEGEKSRWHVVERVAGTFARTFQLPATVAEDRIEATFSNGVLMIRAAKVEQPKPKRIEVRA